MARQRCKQKCYRIVIRFRMFCLLNNRTKNSSINDARKSLDLFQVWSCHLMVLVLGFGYMPFSRWMIREQIRRASLEGFLRYIRLSDVGRLESEVFFWKTLTQKSVIRLTLAHMPSDRDIAKFVVRNDFSVSRKLCRRQCPNTYVCRVMSRRELRHRHTGMTLISMVTQTSCQKRILWALSGPNFHMHHVNTANIYAIHHHHYHCCSILLQSSTLNGR